MPVNRQEIFDGLSDTVYSVSAKYMSINIDSASILKYIASY